MKYLVSTVILLLGLILWQSVEHAYVSRGITCELYYIQGQVDTVKSLDLIINKYKELNNKNSKAFIGYLERIKNFQLYVAELDGIKKCQEIQPTVPEIVYYRIKGMLGK